MKDLPLYEIKADLFRGLAHPLRIRILELVTERDEVGVTALLTATGLKPSNLSQHLAVLRRYGLVTSERRASQVFVRAAHPSVSGLLAAARVLLAATLQERAKVASEYAATATTAASTTAAAALR